MRGVGQLGVTMEPQVTSYLITYHSDFLFEALWIRPTFSLLLFFKQVPVTALDLSRLFNVIGRVARGGSQELDLGGDIRHTNKM